MKTVEMDKDYDFRVERRVDVHYRKGATYTRVPEVQAQAIVDAGAGRIVGDEADADPVAERKGARRK